jgi:AbiJ N-terminal domain 4
MRFSERYGYRPVREIIQIDSMNDELRNALWSMLHVHIWSKLQLSRVYGSTFKRHNEPISLLFSQLWLLFFKQPLDILPDDWPRVIDVVRKFFFEAEWFEVYDFIEFIATHFPYADEESFTEACNTFLRTENSAYRFVDKVIARITEEEQIETIELVMKQAQDPVRVHLHQALELQSNRKNPDYRNSIKESISAVESLVANILGEKGTLGDLLKKFEKEKGLHPALQKAFSSLYGYTSDANGIRHAILESETVTFEEARFFLVICSAFVNFVNSRIKS